MPHTIMPKISPNHLPLRRTQRLPSKCLIIICQIQIKMLSLPPKVSSSCLTFSKSSAISKLSSKMREMKGAVIFLVDTVGQRVRFSRADPRTRHWMWVVIWAKRPTSRRDTQDSIIQMVRVIALLGMELVGRGTTIHRWLKQQKIRLLGVNLQLKTAESSLTLSLDK